LGWHVAGWYAFGRARHQSCRTRGLCFCRAGLRRVHCVPVGPTGPARRSASRIAPPLPFAPRNSANASAVIRNSSVLEPPRRRPHWEGSRRDRTSLGGHDISHAEPAAFDFVGAGLRPARRSASRIAPPPPFALGLHTSSSRVVRPLRRAMVDGVRFAAAPRR
jgi:hypothetical protein